MILMQDREVVNRYPSVLPMQGIDMKMVACNYVLDNKRKDMNVMVGICLKAENGSAVIYPSEWK